MAVAQVQFLERPFVRRLSESVSTELVPPALQNDSLPLKAAKKIVASPANIGTTALGITAAFYIARNILNKAYSSSDSLIKTWLMPALLVFGGGVLKFLDVYGKRIRIKALEKSPLFKKYGTQIIANLQKKIVSAVRSKSLVATGEGSSYTRDNIDFIFRGIIRACDSDNALLMNNVGLKVYSKHGNLFLQTLAEGEHSTCVVEGGKVYGLEVEIFPDDNFETMIKGSKDIHLISKQENSPNSPFCTEEVIPSSINELSSGNLSNILSVLKREDAIVTAQEPATSLLPSSESALPAQKSKPASVSVWPLTASQTEEKSQQQQSITGNKQSAQGR